MQGRLTLRCSITAETSTEDRSTHVVSSSQQYQALSDTIYLPWRKMGKFFQSHDCQTFVCTLPCFNKNMKIVKTFLSCIQCWYWYQSDWSSGPYLSICMLLFCFSSSHAAPSIYCVLIWSYYQQLYDWCRSFKGAIKLWVNETLI